ncbi:BREX-1 system phosphatase PglZ type A [Desulfolucanica intricata]|uniref:BREX-1 system phosphatase PglZ type A n=1 Tax=Desulfolucanica intricata TaxID=1285191 RepID=UPI000829B6A7|nr:BREX-1 system phosphatase PglZ type A [Desulfolucanica intricata]
MNLDEIKKVLDGMLNKGASDGKKRSIVFWYDEEAEFVEEIDELKLENAKILKLKDNNSFAIKYQIEKADTGSNYLIYSSSPKPVPRENWLLDILKYSSEFSTDKTTVIMRDLGVKDASLRNVFKKYMKFFNNKERYKKFASYNIEEYTEQKINIAVLSVLCKLHVPDFEAVVKTILMGELNEVNKYLENIEKFGNMEAFWELVEKTYGYNLPEKTLQNLLIVLMVTHLCYNLEGDIPKTWQEYISTRRSDVIVFMNHFMNHSVDSKIFDKLSVQVEKQLNIKGYINNWDLNSYIKCDTFSVFDEVIIEKLINNLLMDVGEFEKYRKFINSRRTTHWFNRFKEEYEAIYYAMEILRMERELAKTIKGSSAYELVDAYVREYHLLDMFYRKFYTAFDRIENKEPFIKLGEKIENTYTHWYLNELSVKWSGIIEEELKDNWEIRGINRQHSFYDDYIARHIRHEQRVFVIISDALRYEAAREFSSILNTERKGSTEIFFMQGCVPSYTGLGMACLLPHRSVEINERAEILVDGLNSQGTENRQRILLNYAKDAVAVTYNDLKDMKRPEYKEKFEGKKLIYIYHNAIDARGDHAATEREVFDAVEKAYEDLRLLIKNLINNLSATNIYITADHGFIYRRSELKESDKVPKTIANVLVEKRRFILTGDRENIEGTLAFSMNYILGKETNLKAIVPRGVNIFRIQGTGVNYIHGGASLQEIVIPVIKFKNGRSKSDALAVKKVAVKLTNISRKITNRITYLEFFQTEKVEDKRVPMRLKLYFEDEEGNRISNENIIIADSRSVKPEERTYREKFTLKDLPYDRGKKYYLVLEDEEETVEKIYERIPFIIDLAIVNDFGF